MTRGKSKTFPKPAAAPKPAPSVESEPEEKIDEAYASQSRQEQRLQKIIAAAGLTSRRKAEDLILTGRVQVNGATVTELGSKADPTRDHIRVDGKLLRPVDRLHYYILNKPKGYITSASDPEGRPTVMEFFERTPVRVYPVGRLDYQSEGLLVMTNDGELANLLTKASSKVEKTYLVKIAGVPNEAALDQLRAGIMIEKGKPGSHEGRVLTQPARIRVARDAENPWYEVILTEGRNREIRKMFEEIGHFVEKIRRVGYGPLVLDVPPGEVRELDLNEVTSLQRAARGIISRTRPAPIKLPAVKRKAAVRPRPAPAPKAEPEPQIFEVPMAPPDRFDRPKRHEGGAPERAERPRPAGRNTPDSRRPAGGARATGVRFAGGSGDKAAGRPGASRPAGRPAAGGRTAGGGRSRAGEPPSIDPRTGSPYRVLFGEKTASDRSGGPRKPATFDLRKPGAASAKSADASRWKASGRPSSETKAGSGGKPFTGGKSRPGFKAGGPPRKKSASGGRRKDSR